MAQPMAEKCKIKTGEQCFITCDCKISMQIESKTKTTLKQI